MLRLLAMTSASRAASARHDSPPIVDAGFAVAVWPLAAPSASALSNEPPANEVVPGQTSNIKVGVLTSITAWWPTTCSILACIRMAGKVASHGPHKNVKDVFSAVGQHVESEVLAAAPVIFCPGLLV